MPSNNSNASFISTTRANFNLLIKDDNYLYFVLETTGEVSLYLGNNLINEKWFEGANLYGEETIGEYDSGATIAVSNLVGYQYIRAEMYVDSIESGTEAVEIETKIFEISDLKLNSITYHIWTSSTESEWNENNHISSTNVVDSTTKLIEYLNDAFPPENQNVGDAARGTRGELPIEYFYAIVVDKTLIRNSYIKLADGKLTRISDEELKFTAPETTGVTYKLRLIGVDW